MAIRSIHRLLVRWLVPSHCDVSSLRGLSSFQRILHTAPRPQMEQDSLPSFTLSLLSLDRLSISHILISWNRWKEHTPSLRKGNPMVDYT